MKTVFVLFEEIPYEEDVIVGVFSDLKKLKSYRDQWYKDEKTNWIEFKINPTE